MFDVLMYVESVQESAWQCCRNVSFDTLFEWQLQQKAMGERNVRPSVPFIVMMNRRGTEEQGEMFM